MTSLEYLLARVVGHIEEVGFIWFCFELGFGLLALISLVRMALP